MRVCFVCLGNICRSPTAEGVFRALAEERGLGDRFTVESAGTAAYHEGEAPDARSAAEAARHGVRLTSSAQRFTPDDFARFDLVVAMDRRNLEDLEAMAQRDRPEIRLLREFASTDPGLADVPDPYYGEGSGFATVYAIVEDACGGLLDHLTE